MKLSLTISNPKTGKSFKKEYEGELFLHKKIGDKLEGDKIGFSGYEFKISGGSDKSGFPMRPDLPGFSRKNPLVVQGVGAKKKEKGMNQRKTVKGNTIDENITQVNLKVEKEGKESLEKILGIEASKEEGKEEAKETPKEQN